MALATLELVQAPIEEHLAPIYMLPASLLSDEPVDEQDTSSLRAEASSNGVCYLHLLKALPDGLTYVAKVAAHPEQVMQGFILIVSYKHLAQAWLYQA